MVRSTSPSQDWGEVRTGWLALRARVRSPQSEGAWETGLRGFGAQEKSRSWAAASLRPGGKWRLGGRLSNFRVQGRG